MPHPNMKLFNAISLALALLCSVCASHAQSEKAVNIGVQTWTLRNLDFDQVVAFASKHNLKYVQLIGKHIDPMKATPEEIKQKKAALDKAGLIPYTFGVAGTSLDKEQNRKLFEFAKTMGMKLIIVEPNDFKILDNLEELVKEYDIKIAIHNHGIKSLYGNPAVVRALLKHRDPRMGVCLDAGWVASGRFDPARTFTEYDGRVFDIHLKDKKVNTTDRGDVATDVFIGQGDANLAKLLETVAAAKWDGVLAIETDNDLRDPTQHIENAWKFLKEQAVTAK